ncbi:hypothetical protein Y047_4910 [Burkholderia pseudomallei MSHR3016]|nr:hypothetical protein Y047_4910 [Burkholderia pseudomallei MSHR3016]KGW98738.1 hypothetical protein Y034_5866 [Burkholderia pseudomallei MSHR449]
MTGGSNESPGILQCEGRWKLINRETAMHGGIPCHLKAYLLNRFGTY